MSPAQGTSSWVGDPTHERADKTNSRASISSDTKPTTDNDHGAGMSCLTSAISHIPHNLNLGSERLPLGAIAGADARTVRARHATLAEVHPHVCIDEPHPRSARGADQGETNETTHSRVEATVLGSCTARIRHLGEWGTSPRRSSPGCASTTRGRAECPRSQRCRRCSACPRRQPGAGCAVPNSRPRKLPASGALLFSRRVAVPPRFQEFHSIGLPSDMKET